MFIFFMFRSCLILTINFKEIVDLMNYTNDNSLKVIENTVELFSSAL